MWCQLGTLAAGLALEIWLAFKVATTGDDQRVWYICWLIVATIFGVLLAIAYRYRYDIGVAVLRQETMLVLRSQANEQLQPLATVCCDGPKDSNMLRPRPLMLVPKDAMTGVPLPSATPADETTWGTEIKTKALTLYQYYGPRFSGPPLQLEPAALQAYLRKRLTPELLAAAGLPFPERPLFFDDPTADVLAELAVRGPYSYLLKAVRRTAPRPSVAAATPAAAVEEEFEIDLRCFAGIEHRSDSLPVGTRTIFTRDAETGRLSTSRVLVCDRKGVDSWAFPETRQSQLWQQVQRQVTAGMRTHQAVVAHLLQTHLCCSQAMAMAMRGTLSGGHPLRTLLFRHAFGTIAIDRSLGPLLVFPGRGSFIEEFSFTQAGLYDLMSKQATTFRFWETVHPILQLEARGLSVETAQALGCTTQLDALDVFGVIHAHVTSWITHHWHSIRGSLETTAFLDSLETLIPGGIRRAQPISCSISMGDRGSSAQQQQQQPQQAGMGHLIELCSALIHNACVTHEWVGNLIWCYGLNYDWIPGRVLRSTYGPTNGDGAQGVGQEIYDRVVAKYLVANNSRFVKLIDDQNEMSVSQADSEMLHTFRRDLEALAQRQLKQTDRNQFPYSRILVTNLESSIRE